MKKCPRCDSINADSDSSCGVCGGSLSGIVSESLEHLVQNETTLKPKKKSNVGAIVLAIFALATTVAGAALLFFNVIIGIILLLVGLPAILVMAGGAGGPMKRGLGFQGGRAMMRRLEEDRRHAEELKKRKCKED